jgi:antibiotic biosynthesis monooxygenase (ABM) superfamily enzyme
MKRRSYLKAILAAASGLGAASAQERKQQPANPIVLYVDLSVDPAKEQEMLRNFHNTVKPAAMKYPGYINMRMCKLRSAIQGAAPSGVNYRFEVTYQSEELRQKWVASDTHQKVWPTIENTLRSKDYTVLLFDSM